MAIELTKTLRSKKSEKGMIKLNDFEMRYCHFGNGPRNMIILPGLSALHVSESADILAKRFASFLNDFSIYVLDVRENIPDGYRLIDLAEDTYRAICYLNLKDLYVYSASMGGMQAICLDAMHPERIKKLMLASVEIQADETFSKNIKEWIKLAKSGDGLALAKDFAKCVYGKNTQNQYGKALYSYGKKLTLADLDRFIHAAEAIQNVDILEMAKMVKIETLIINSKGDQLLNQLSFEKLKQAMPKAKTYLYGEEYGHAFYDEVPDFLNLLRSFFMKE